MMDNRSRREAPCWSPPVIVDRLFLFVDLATDPLRPTGSFYVVQCLTARSAQWHIGRRRQAVVSFAVNTT
jgi:hypothetical protein